MNPSTTAVTLNMALPNIATVAWAVQGDMLSRQIEATLVDGSTAWNPPAGADGVVRYYKPDGTSGAYDVDEGGDPAVTWSGNVATVKIVQQALTVAGTVIMQLEFYDSNQQRLSAFGWAMNVQPSALTDTEFLSTDYYSLLTLQIAAVLGATANPPYIDPTTKNWMIWDEDEGGYVNSGYSSVGLTGPYFTPSVSAAGVISWTNNGGLPNPTSRNIKGPQGVSISGTSKASGTGAPGTTDVYNVNLDNGTVGGTFSVYNGEDGQGSPGSQLPIMDGTASAGSASAYSREDHVHPTDTSRAPATLAPTVAVADLNTLADTDVHLYKYDGNTLNTPFKQGITVNGAGTVISYSNDAAFAVQLCICSGNNDMYIRSKVSGTWSIWSAIRPKVSSLTLSATWSGTDPYTQTVTIANTTAKTKVNVQMSETVLGTLADAGVTALFIKNENGTLTAYALGAKPPQITIQVECYDVV